MGVEYVKTIPEMLMANKVFYKRYRQYQDDILHSLVNYNEEQTKNIVEKHNFTGVLYSNLRVSSPFNLCYQFISSASHSVFMEEGVRPHYVNKELLHGWIEAKGIVDENNEPVKGIIVGNPNSEESVIKKPGLRFMERGFDLTANRIDAEIISRILLL